jgi:hypothetical protein
MIFDSRKEWLRKRELQHYVENAHFYRHAPQMVLDWGGFAAGSSPWCY